MKRKKQGFNFGSGSNFLKAGSGFFKNQYPAGSKTVMLCHITDARNLYSFYSHRILAIGSDRGGPGGWVGEAGRGVVNLVI